MNNHKKKKCNASIHTFIYKDVWLLTNIYQTKHTLCQNNTCFQLKKKNTVN